MTMSMNRDCTLNSSINLTDTFIKTDIKVKKNKSAQYIPSLDKLFNKRQLIESESNMPDITVNVLRK